MMMARSEQSHTDPTPTVEVVSPPVDDGLLSGLLRELTRQIDAAGLAEKSMGFLGGEDGYGADFDCDVFMMHPFCWCESPECPWCLACDCGEDASLYFVDGNRVSSERYFDEIRLDRKHAERFTWEDVPERQCVNCREPRTSAPNFRHKASGFEVRWYKYIGRSMETDGPALSVQDLLALFNGCFSAVSEASK